MLPDAVDVFLAKNKLPRLVPGGPWHTSMHPCIHAGRPCQHGKTSASKGKGREGKGREGKGREGKGREGKGREGKGRKNERSSKGLHYHITI